MTELHTAVYREPRTFEQYSTKEHLINLYPNETVIENYKPEKMEGSESEPEPYTGYQYEGEELDGGYIRECNDPKNLHDIVNAIIRTKYSQSEEFAIQRHYQNEPEEYQEKWTEYCSFADKAAELGRKWLKMK